MDVELFLNHDIMFDKIKLFLVIALIAASVTSYSQEVKYPNVTIGKKKLEKLQGQTYTPLKKGDKYGYADSKFDFVVKPVFDMAGAGILIWNDYVYPVCYKGKWGLMNHDGSYEVEPILDKHPVWVTGQGIICTCNGNTFVVTKYKEHIVYNALEYADGMVYFPKGDKGIFYYQPKKHEHRFETSQTVFVSEHPECKMYAVRTMMGSFLFDMAGNAIFSAMGPAKDYKLRYMNHPQVHMLKYVESGQEKFTICTSDFQIIARGCSAVETYDGYVLCLKANELIMYDGKTHRFKLQSDFVATKTETPLAFLNKVNKYILRNLMSVVSGDNVTSVTVNTVGVDYVLVKTKDDRMHFYTADGTEICNLSSNAQFDQYDKTRGYVKISHRKADGKMLYGFINISKSFWIPPVFAQSNMMPTESFVRVKSTIDSSYDMIYNVEHFYRPHQYEQYLYHLYIEDKERYCNAYLQDNLLHQSEKKSYDEVLAFAKRMQRRTDIDSSHIFTWKSERYAMECEENGNIYTYDVMSANGFIYRQKRSLYGETHHPEIVINSFDNQLYIPVRDITGFSSGNLSRLSLSWAKKIGDEIYAQYNWSSGYEDEYVVGTETKFSLLTINPVTAVPEVKDATEDIYETIRQTRKYFIKIDESGVKHRMALANDYDSISFTYDYIIVRGVDNIACLDYNFNMLFAYTPDESVKLAYCYRFQDKWIVVGSTVASGYVGYENYYVLVTDMNGNKISDSTFPIKNGRLNKIQHSKENIFVVTSGQDGFPNKTISIENDGSITWL